MRTAIVLAFAPLALALSAPAHADWMRVLSGSFPQVAAAGEHAAAIRQQEVLIVRADGRVISRLANAEIVGRPAHAPALPALPALNDATDQPVAAERILDRLEIPEIDRGNDYTDELVEDESRLGQRRFWRSRRRSAVSSRGGASAVLSASPHEIWIANDRGIFRVGEAGTVNPAFGRQWGGSRIAAAQGRILVDRGSALALLSATEAETHFIESSPPIGSPIGHLAISPSGARIAWTTSAAIHLVSATGNATMDAPEGILHIAFCGETLVALLAQGALAIPPEGHPEMRAAPTRARKLICPPGPDMPWVAIGEGLWISSDQSQQWTSVSVPKGSAMLDAAVSDHHVWLGTTAGLYVSVDATVAAETSRESQPSRGHGHAGTSRLAWLMPKVSVRAAATFAPTGRRLEGFAFAAFPLGSKTIGVAAVNMPEDSPPAVEPPRMARISEVRDAEAACLPLARRKAIELAMTEPERARSYVTRAGHAAWLPELRVLLSRRYGRSESLDVNGSSTALSSPLGIDTVNDIRYEARATWDLGRLVFSSEELAAQAQALHMAELRRDIETTMNRLYFERRRLIVGSSRDSIARTKEIEAELDAMSAGAFGACTADKSIGAR
jgi:hypothetical protein